MLRVFAGIPVPENIRAEVLVLKEKYKELPLRWVGGTGLHITIVQPWYAENADCAVGEIADLASATKPFYLTFRKLAFGTSPKKPRLIWTMGEDFDRDAMLTLKASAERVFGQHPDARPYTPHITIARFKEEDYSGIPATIINEQIDWSMEVNSVVLYESKLNQTGAEYEVLKTIEINS